jgi:hypothetical protein
MLQSQQMFRYTKISPDEERTLSIQNVRLEFKSALVGN